MSEKPQEKCGRVHIELCCVFVSNDGAEVYEPRFVDETGQASETLVVHPSGKLAVSWEGESIRDTIVRIEESTADPQAAREGEGGKAQ